MSAQEVRETRTEPVEALQGALDGTATVYDPSGQLCAADGTCSMFKDGELVYRDESHLSVEGAGIFADELRVALERIAGG